MGKSLFSEVKQWENPLFPKERQWEIPKEEENPLFPKTDKGKFIIP